MKLSEIKTVLKADVLYGEQHLDRSVSGAGGADLMNDVLASAAENALLLTGLTTEQVLCTARIARVGAVVFVRGKSPEARIIEMARADDIPVLLTQYSLFAASGRLYMNGLRGLDGSW